MSGVLICSYVYKMAKSIDLAKNYYLNSKSFERFPKIEINLGRQAGHTTAFKKIMQLDLFKNSIFVSNFISRGPKGTNTPDVYRTYELINARSASPDYIIVDAYSFHNEENQTMINDFWLSHSKKPIRIYLG